MALTIQDHLAQLDATLAIYPTEYLLDYRIHIRCIKHMGFYDTPEGLEALAAQPWHSSFNSRWLNSVPGTVAEEVSLIVFNKSDLRGTVVRPKYSSRADEVAGVDLHIEGWKNNIYTVQVKSQPLPKDQFVFGLKWLEYTKTHRLFVVDPVRWRLLNMDFPTVCEVAREIQRKNGNKTQVTIPFETMKKTYGSYFNVRDFPNKLQKTG